MIKNPFVTTITRVHSDNAKDSKPVLFCVIGVVRLYQVWDQVHDYFFTQTKARAHQLPTDLRNQTLGTQSMHDFLSHIKSIVDAILEGLSHEYVVVISVVESKFETPPLLKWRIFFLLMKHTFNVIKRLSFLLYQFITLLMLLHL